MSALLVAAGEGGIVVLEVSSTEMREASFPPDLEALSASEDDFSTEDLDEDVESSDSDDLDVVGGTRGSEAGTEAVDLEDDLDDDLDEDLDDDLDDDLEDLESNDSDDDEEVNDLDDDLDDLDDLDDDLDEDLESRDSEE